MFEGFSAAQIGDFFWLARGCAIDYVMITIIMTAATFKGKKPIRTLLIGSILASYILVLGALTPFCYYGLFQEGRNIDLTPLFIVLIIMVGLIYFRVRIGLKYSPVRSLITGLLSVVALFVGFAVSTQLN